MDYGTYPAFTGLNPEQVQSILAVAENLEFAAGEHILEAGQSGTHLHLLLGGKVRVFVPGEGGREQEIAVASAPCVLGELELINDGPHLATVASLETCATLTLPYGVVRQRLLAEDLAMHKLMMNICGVIAQRLSQVDRKIVALLEAQTDAEAHSLEGLRGSLFEKL